MTQCSGQSFRRRRLSPIESIFAVKAQALGIALSEPKGDNQAFDFIGTTPLGTFRIQVKSAWKLVKNRYIAIFNRRKVEKLNRASGFDYVVVYIAPMDVWYVIPASALRKRWLKLYPNILNSKGEYERFREAWRLLTGIPGDDTYRVGLTIHAGRST